MVFYLSINEIFFQVLDPKNTSRFVQINNVDMLLSSLDTMCNSTVLSKDIFV